ATSVSSCAWGQRLQMSHPVTVQLRFRQSFPNSRHCSQLQLHRTVWLAFGLQLFAAFRRSGPLCLSPPPDLAHPTACININLRSTYGGQSALLRRAMGQRREPRTETKLAVRIFGTDTGGKMFSENVSTLDISREGARLGGLQAQVKPGEIVGITHGVNKSR